MERNRMRHCFTGKMLVILALFICLFSTAASAAKLKVKMTDDIKVYMTVGESANLKAKGTGGSGKYQYQFGYKRNGGALVTFRKMKASAKAVFKPEKQGAYTIYVKIKDKKTGKKKTVQKRVWVKTPMSAKASTARKKIVSTAKKWLKTKEGSKKHQKILNYYNKYKNNMYRTANFSFYGLFKYMHYTMTVDQDWCDTFVSSVFIQCKMAKISGVECGCIWHIFWLIDNDSFVEDDDYVPYPGDIIFYCWSDSGSGDCKGVANHVGIVEKVDDTGLMTIIEGNYNDKVQRRKIKVNAQYIRGYGVPDFDSL